MLGQDYLSHYPGRSIGPGDFAASFRELPEIEGDELVRLNMEVNEVERRLLAIQEQNASLLNTLRRLTKFIVSNPHRLSDLTVHPDENKRSVSCGDGVEKDWPQILYRFQTDSKESHYDEELGILCPGWRNYFSADSPIAKEQVVKHLARDDRSSPPFLSYQSQSHLLESSISASVSPSRIATLESLSLISASCKNWGPGAAGLQMWSKV